MNCFVFVVGWHVFELIVVYLILLFVNCAILNYVIFQLIGSFCFFLRTFIFRRMCFDFVLFLYCNREQKGIIIDENETQNLGSLKMRYSSKVNEINRFEIWSGV